MKNMINRTAAALIIAAIFLAGCGSAPAKDRLISSILSGQPYQTLELPAL